MTVKTLPVVSEGVVINCVIVDDADIPDIPGLIQTEAPEFGIGWTYDGATFAPPPRRSLSADPQSIAPDGVALSTVTYTDTHDDAPTQVVFTVNGVTASAPLAGTAATLTVTSGTPGDVIDVTVDQPGVQPVTINVLEA